MSSEAVKHIIATIFSAQNALRDLAPDFRWAGMGNLLGDYGEFYCIENYGLTKAPPGSAGFDAIMPDGRTVQIKTNHASKTVGFRGNADLMLAVYVSEVGEVEQIYFGKFDKVAEASNYSARDNKRSITVTKLKKLAESVAQELPAS